MLRANFVWQNVIAIFPALIGVAYLAMVPFLINIAADCPPNAALTNRDRVVTVILPDDSGFAANPPMDLPRFNSKLLSIAKREFRKGNPLVCKTGEWWDLIKEALLQHYKSYHKGISDADASALSDEVGSRRRAYETALMELTKAVAAQPASTTDKDPLSAWHAGVELAEKRAKVLGEQMSAFRQEQSETLAAAAREAKGRFAWVVAASVLFIANITAIITMLWAISDTTTDFVRAETAYQRWEQQTDLRSMAASAVVVGLLLYMAWLAMRWGAANKLFDGMLRLPGRDYYYYFFPNSLFAYIESSLMPGISGFVSLLGDLSLFGAIAMAISAATCLLVRAKDLECWRLSSSTTSVQRVECVRFMVHSSRRLFAVAIMGSALLVAHVGQVWALLSWPASLLATDTIGGGLRLEMAAAINQMVIGVAVGASILLGTLLLPAALILRRRTWLVALAEPSLASADAETIQNWMKKNGLLYSVSSSVVQALAVLAPLIAGTVATSLQSAMLK